MDFKEKIKKIALDGGLWEAGFVEIDELKVYPEVRKMCADNVCRAYGTTWACPPAVGTIEECLARCQQYDKMMLFSKKYDLEDSYDFEGMQEGMADFKKQVTVFSNGVKEHLKAYFLFGNEGCGNCKSCTYPDAPCRFPEKMHPSLEGYGFIVSDLAKKAGVHYINGQNTVTYFGAILWKNEDETDACC